MSVNNGVGQISAIIGARLYTDVFNSMLPLIVVSAAFTFACFLLLPILHREQIDRAYYPGSHLGAGVALG
jgi:hypothetical protein